MYRLLFISLFLTSTALATTWTVDDDGKADFDNIQAAVDASSDGDEILVMEGMYVEHNIDLLGKAIVIEGTKNSSGELVSVVHGNWQGSVFVCTSGETDFTVLKNLLITGGSAFLGGGMYIEESAPSLVGCTFMNNYATKGFGGGMCIIDGTLSLVDCTFTGNIGGVGGGVYNQPEYGSAHEVRGCLFQNNQAVNGNYGHGGGLKHSKGFLDISNCDFVNNSATGGGGGMSEFATNGVLIHNCTFTGNIAQGGGGLDTGGIGGCTIISSTFNGNQSTMNGGGIQSASPSLYIINSRLTNNVADLLGGAVLMLYADQQPAMFVNCIMDNNTTYAGATVSIHGTLATKFVNTTIINNTGPGLYLEGWEGQQVQVLNSIVWGNSTIPISVNGDLDVDVRFSDIEGGWEGEGNINADPQIIFNQETIMIHVNSPCIDIASNEVLPNDALDLDEDGNFSEPLPVDFYGEARIQGAAVDMGSFEYFAANCLGDINGDAVVNVVDILEIISEWGSADSPADINQDGIVDVSDLLIVVGNWGECE
jgi:hypothetical protein